MIFKGLLKFKYSTRKTNKKNKKKTGHCPRSKNWSKPRNIKSAMKYTQLSTNIQS